MVPLSPAGNREVFPGLIPCGSRTADYAIMPADLKRTGFWSIGELNANGKGRDSEYGSKLYADAGDLCADVEQRAPKSEPRAQGGHPLVWLPHLIWIQEHCRVLGPPPHEKSRRPALIPASTPSRGSDRTRVPPPAPCGGGGTGVRALDPGHDPGHGPGTTLVTAHERSRQIRSPRRGLGSGRARPQPRLNRRRCRGAPRRGHVGRGGCRMGKRRRKRGVLSQERLQAPFCIK